MGSEQLQSHLLNKKKRFDYFYSVNSPKPNNVIPAAARVLIKNLINVDCPLSVFKLSLDIIYIRNKKDLTYGSIKN